MHSCSISTVLVGCLLLSLCFCLPAGAVNASEKEKKARNDLQALQEKIQRASDSLNSATNRKNKLQEQLRDAELSLGALQQQTRENKKAIEAAETELRGLKVQRTTLEVQRAGQQERLALELAAAWKMNRSGGLKVLLNQEDPHTAARAMAYYRYFFDARSKLVDEFKLTLQAVDNTRANIVKTSDALSHQQDLLLQQEQQLQKAHRARQQAVTLLAKDIDRKGSQLQQLEQDRSQLEQLLTAIDEALQDAQTRANTPAFDSARGDMPWPLSGKPGNRFGSARNAGKMRWQGLNIPAAQGSEVNAIHHGRVVYADWFRGSGLLLIVDHGAGYMSLYAHNETLLRDVGDWVSTGTTLSTVGNSGGLERPALYFEIRFEGKPQDPGKWCKR